MTPATTSSACHASERTFCIAVGTLAETWNGATWTVVPPKVPPSANGRNFYSIFCFATQTTNANMCETLGTGLEGGTQVVIGNQWNGSSWSLVPAATPTGSSLNPELTSMNCTWTGSIAPWCAAVPESSYFAWRTRPPSPRSIRHVWLTDMITHVHAASRGTYGHRRVHAELTLGQGISVGHTAIEMLMRRAGIKGIVGNPRRKHLHQIPTATDLVERQFARAAPNQLWVTDITGIGHERERSTAPLSSTRTRVAWLAGPSTRHPTPRW
jgi:hypothetical protein